MKRNYTETVIRIDEKLRALIDKVDNLYDHVNEENAKFDKRIRALEDSSLKYKVQLRTLLIIIGGTSGLSIGLVKLLELIGVVI